MLSHSVRGQGKPVVLVHGLFGTRENLGGIARFLSEHFQVYSVDLPNHGLSEHDNHADLPRMAKALQAWMTHIGLSSAYFFGHSLGGKVAMQLALDSPDLVETLVVADIAPVTYHDRHSDVFRGLFAVDLTRLTRRSDADVALKPFIPELPVRSFLLKNLQKDTHGNFNWRMNLQGLYDNYSRLIEQNIQAVYDKPVLFLKAEHSDYMQPEHHDAIVSRFPKAQFKVISNTGHWLHAEKPELVSSLTRRFFEV